MRFDLSRLLLMLSLLLSSAFTAGAQVFLGDDDDDTDPPAAVILDDFFGDDADDKLTKVEPDTAAVKLIPDTLVIDTTIDVSDLMLPKWFIATPIVFTNFVRIDSVAPFSRTFSDNPALQWVDRGMRARQHLQETRQRYFVHYLDQLKYNLADLPDPPKQYVAYADPEHAKIVVEEVTVSPAPGDTDLKVDTRRKHWIESFNGTAQFAQAYNSSNWYQGGNSNVNLRIAGIYNINLNTAYHPNLLFNNTIQYRLSINSAPNDTVRSYNISEDLFQVNSTFGLKAFKSWYYTITLLAKTQFLQNFPANSNTVKSAFLAPGELNLGLGMTYSHTNPKKTFTLNFSMAPLSYNLKSCLSQRVSEVSLGIKEGHKTVSQYGSNMEVKFTWNIAYNIVYNSRFYVFSDYSYLQGDWENTINFSFNRYISTQIICNMRYDSSRKSDTAWKCWQMKEMLTFGFAYTFATV
ncbi:MAG: DUF3078 domain-containing protein [Bacteroidales bacterium]|nr:DUF3078 domain-containing protein [Bacteroidales bacterium]